ncbi:hypothetical protein [Pseudalkalibacillus salsuginis]|uniref:hypothetical protein n=1 Tax=Pseudalkalibacillus salsuginis TaxID=2910972 RepID=UPI001F3E7984|nr:hypothetical protein [Pseudalkalibacillus salsuginis]MCF6410203.1 hypothetical protein [Pseudalkalibacillus salsuginis]
MAKQILDYFVSAPATSNGSLNRVVPASPSTMKLAEFGLSLPTQAQQVELTATVGWETTAGSPIVLFKIFRGTQIIFTTTSQIDITVETSRTVAFNAVDFNVPAGRQVYSLTVELTNPVGLLNQASVIGPVTFTGIAIADA